MSVLAISVLADHISASPLVMKVRSKASSVRSGALTPGIAGMTGSLSERDLQKADEALENAKLNGST
jgi:glycogen(starch) synthase